jgi:hypothetical protein
MGRVRERIDDREREIIKEEKRVKKVRSRVGK